MKKVILLSLLVFAAGTTLFAGFWDWSTPYQGPENDVITLVITGNYKQSRAMAEVIQAESNQPYILLPYRGAKGVFFCPGGLNPEALEVQADQFAQFIAFINPKRIVILGDERYVPVEYRQLLEYNGYAPVTFTGDWNQICRDVAQLLRLRNLTANYKAVMEATKGNYIPNRGKDLEDSSTVITVEQ